jgi:hypothetical protein
VRYVIYIYDISRLRVKCQRFGTLCLFHLHRRVGMKCYRSHTQYLLAYEDGTECFETLAIKLQNNTKQSICHSKLWHLNYRITQNKAYVIQNMAKV